MTGPQIAAQGIAPADKPIAARIQWRHQYDDAADAIERELTASTNNEPSMTMQHFREDADLNVAMRRMGVTDGAIPPADHAGIEELTTKYYGDFTDAADLKDSLNRIQEAWAHFDSLPADLRARFENDPVQLYEWVNDPSNKQEAIDLHILRQDPAATPIPATPLDRANQRIAQYKADLEKATTAPAPIPPSAQGSTAPTTPK